MKRIFQSLAFLGALAVGQQAFAQESTKKPEISAKNSEQELSENTRHETRKNPFYIKRFSRENFLYLLPYDKDNQGENGSYYFTRSNPTPSNELREFAMENPLLRTFSVANGIVRRVMRMANVFKK